MKFEFCLYPFLLILILTFCIPYFSKVKREIPKPFQKIYLKNKIDLENTDDIKCLDGSDYSYYYSKGNPQYLFVFFQGQEMCNEKEDFMQCYLSTNSDLLPKNIALDSGIFNKNRQFNQAFFDFSVLYLKSCDGIGFFGYNQDPVKNEIDERYDLYIKGHNITYYMVENIIQNYIDADKTEKVILIGQQQGGISILQWSNHILKKLPKNIELKAVLDSSFYLDFENVNGKKQIRKSLKGLQKIMDKKFFDYCLNDGENPYKKNNRKELNCLLPENLLKYQKIPIFFLQSTYNQWQLQNVLNATCVFDIQNCDYSDYKQANIIEDYQYEIKSKLIQYAQKSQNSSIMIQSGAQHKYLMKKKTYTIEQMVNIKRWIFDNEQIIKIQDQYLDIDEIDQSDIRGYLKDLQNNDKNQKQIQDGEILQNIAYQIKNPQYDQKLNDQQIVDYIKNNKGKKISDFDGELINFFKGY